MTGDTPIQTARIRQTSSPEATSTEKARETAGTLATAPPRLTTLILLSALAVLPVNMILPSLPDIAAAFKADFALVNLSVAGYAIVTALTELVAGAMSDRYGRRPVALASISLFIAASLGCAVATHIGAFLLFRMLQASIAACFSIALVMAKEGSGERKATSRLGYLSMGWAIAPMLGPMVGGALNELFGWRSSFLVFALLGAASLALSLRELKETATPPARRRGHYLASYRPLLGSKRFWAYTLCMAFSMGTVYIFLGGAPLALGPSSGGPSSGGPAHVGSSAELGLYMGMIPAGFILGSYLAGRCAPYVSLAATLIFARLLTCAGLATGLLLSITGNTHALAFFAPCIFIGLGNGLTLPAANSGVLSVRPDLAGTAAGLSAAMMIGGGALVASVGGLCLGGQGVIHTLFATMLASASLALLAALYAALIDRRLFSDKPGDQAASLTR